MIKKARPNPHKTPRADEWSLSAAFNPAMNKTKMARCASPLAYCPVYTAPTPNGKNPARMPATAGFGPLPTGGGGGGTCPDAAGENAAAGKPPEATPDVPAEVPAGTPSIFAPRQSSQ